MKTATITKNWTSGQYRKGAVGGIAIDATYVAIKPETGTPYIETFDLTVTDYSLIAGGASATANGYKLSDDNWFCVPEPDDPDVAANFTIYGDMKVAHELSGNYLRVKLRFGPEGLSDEIGFVCAFDIPSGTLFEDAVTA